MSIPRRLDELPLDTDRGLTEVGRRMACVGVGLFLTLTMESFVYAKESSDVEEGAYLGLSFVQNNMSGDFDDTLFLASPPDVFDIPDVDDGSGFGIVLGVGSGKGAFEVGYQRTTHDTSSSFIDVGKNGESEASYNVVDLNFKFDVFAQRRLSPYLLFGFGFTWLTIDDSATDGASFEDETFFGYAVNAGAGVSYYFNPRFAVSGGITHRWNWFTSVEGENIDDAVKEQALNFTVGIAYSF